MLDWLDQEQLSEPLNRPVNLEPDRLPYNPSMQRTGRKRQSAGMVETGRFKIGRLRAPTPRRDPAKRRARVKNPLKVSSHLNSAPDYSETPEKNKNEKRQAASQPYFHQTSEYWKGYDTGGGGSPALVIDAWGKPRRLRRGGGAEGHPAAS